MYVTLLDGREITAPLTPRLLDATQAQRDRGRVEDFGTALWWDDIDEDLGVAALFGVRESELEALAGFDVELAEPPIGDPLDR